MGEEYKKHIDQLIEEATKDSTEMQGTSELVARMMCPLTGSRTCDGSALGTKEHIVVDNNGYSVPMDFVRGATDSHSSHSLWDVYRRMKTLIPEGRVSQEYIYKRFHFTYGVMAICRRLDEHGTSQILMEVHRSNESGSQASFPSGSVLPNESLGEALFRKLREETGVVDVDMKGGWSVFRWPDAPHITFGTILTLKTGDDVQGGRFSWIKESKIQSSASVRIPKDGMVIYKRLLATHPTRGTP